MATVNIELHGGRDKHPPAPDQSHHFSDILRRRLTRRAVVQGGIAATLMVVSRPSAVAGQDTESALTFTPIEPTVGGNVPTVPAGYSFSPLVRWGDPVMANAPTFDPTNLTAASQALQAGYNCDYVGFLPLPIGSSSSNHGLLVINNEYTNPELMFPDYDPATTTAEIVNTELEAHGMTVVEVVRENGKWSVVRDSRLNRRITGTTPILLTGPAAGDDWLKTNADITGSTVLGTLGNCSGGLTPWGTVVSGEENFTHYFAYAGEIDEADSLAAIHARYGLPRAGSAHNWESVDERFDLRIEPNEPLRFGWPVEFDPYDPASPVKKRTALGRNKHEGNAATLAPNGKVVLYSGDDQQFEYAYKFVTAGTHNAEDRAANIDLLDEGTLYVARFNDDGSGQWLPLVYGQGGLTEAAGFASQAEVLINTRTAADTVGATKMDRPEDMEMNPVNGKVYLALTNNVHRGLEGNPEIDAANPRADNRYGHVIEIIEGNFDATSTEFTWEIFLLAGDAADDETWFAGFPKELVSSFACPDNVTFDRDGNLWIATNGQPGTLGVDDGLFVVPTEGSERGYVRQFLAGVAGAEITGPMFTPDNTALFVSIQHPGEGGTFEDPLSNFPDGNGSIPRPTVIVITRDDGGVIGS
jgi:secreted PhoX family phosphatase